VIGFDEEKPLDEIVVNDCIPPLETFSYSAIDNPDKPLPGQSLIVLPTNPWKVEASLLDLEIGVYPSHVLATRSRNGTTEIWTANRSYSALSPHAEPYNFAVYDTDTKTWRNVLAEVEDSGVFVQKLFIAEDGSLWGQNIWDKNAEITNRPILSKFNEEIERFEFERETEQIPPISGDSSQWSIVLISKSMFWILAHEDAIYSYNSNSKEVKRHAEISDTVVTDADVSPNGNIYFSNTIMSLYMDDAEIFQYTPATEKLEMLPIQLEPWPYSSSLLVDHLGRLWISSLGWRDTDNTWYQIHRSPIFITNIRWSGLEYRWKPPENLIESSDGRLWFRSPDNGLSWLDPDKGEWCWFTTYQSTIVEDQEENLWMIVDSKLYKLDLE
jgi:hypothetical protein